MTTELPPIEERAHKHYLELPAHARERKAAHLLKECVAELRRLRKNAVDLLDTVHACLKAAGGSEDIDELERQCNAVGTKPSDFVKTQFVFLRYEVVRLREENERLKDQLARIVGDVSDTWHVASRGRAPEEVSSEAHVNAALSFIAEDYRK